jgi:hypothetical protein
MIQPHVAGMGEAMDALAPWGAGLEPVMDRPLLPDGVLRTHRCRCG